MRLEYIAAAFDASGYGEAARNNIAALHRAGVDVRLIPISFEQRRPDLGAMGAFLQTLTADGPPPDVRIIHLTPDIWRHALTGRSKCPTVGYAVWEASRIPNAWRDEINALAKAGAIAEVWVPSTHNVHAFRGSGVTTTVVRVPHCFASPVVEPGLRILPESDRYRFLSVFQWLERKNPIGLLKAYLTEFTADEKVSLVLKTFLKDGTEEERQQIKAAINEVKAGLRLAAYPQVELIVKTLSRAELDRLYRECDCYVSLHRCEGFGIPIAEAMLAELPVVVTGCGGPWDYLDNEHTGTCECGLVGWHDTPVYGMPWSHYTGEMLWAEPDLQGARYRMAVKARGAHLAAPENRQQILDLFGYEKIGGMMRSRMAKLCGHDEALNPNSSGNMDS